jgi:hypothetical protein
MLAAKSSQFCRLHLLHKPVHAKVVGGSAGYRVLAASGSSEDSEGQPGRAEGIRRVLIRRVTQIGADGERSRG